MDKLTIFISTPMKDKTEEEIEKRFEIITELVFTFCKFIRPNFKREDLNVIDNFHHEDLDPDAGRLMHLGRSIQQMQDANLVVFDANWATANGCTVENCLCDQYHIPYICYSNNQYIWHDEIKKVLNA